MQLKTVVLPAPFGPIRLTISPAAIWKLTASTASRPPKRQVSWRTLSSGWAVVRGPDPASGAVVTTTSDWLGEHLGIGRLFELELTATGGEDSLGTEAHHQ